MYILCFQPAALPRDICAYLSRLLPYTHSSIQADSWGDPGPSFNRAAPWLFSSQPRGGYDRTGHGRAGHGRAGREKWIYYTSWFFYYIYIYIYNILFFNFNKFIDVPRPGPFSPYTFLLSDSLSERSPSKPKTIWQLRHLIWLRPYIGALGSLESSWAIIPFFFWKKKYEKY